MGFKLRSDTRYHHQKHYLSQACHDAVPQFPRLSKSNKATSVTASTTGPPRNLPLAIKASWQESCGIRGCRPPRAFPASKKLSPYTTHLVVVLLHEAAQRQAKALVGPHAPVHGVDSPGRFIFVDLLPFAVQGHGGGWAAEPAGEAAGWGRRRAGSPAWVSGSERRRDRGAQERPSPPAGPLLHTHTAWPDHQFQTSSGSDHHLPFGKLARPLGTEATRLRSDDERWLPGTSFPNCSFFLLVNTALATRIFLTIGGNVCHSTHSLPPTPGGGLF